MRWWIRSLSEAGTFALTRFALLTFAFTPLALHAETGSTGAPLYADAGIRAAPTLPTSPAVPQLPAKPEPAKPDPAKPDAGSPPPAAGTVLPGLQNGPDAGTMEAIRPEDPVTAEARLLSDQAKLAYDGGKFREALKLYSEAYRKRPLPGFLFNIGQCHRQLGAFDRAAFFFGRYLDVSPDAQNVELARSLLLESEQKAQLAIDDEKKRIERELTEAHAARQRAELDAANVRAQLLAGTPRDPTQPTLNDAPVYRQWWFWAAAGGVAAAVVGTVIIAQPHPRTPSLGTVDLR